MKKCDFGECHCKILSIAIKCNGCGKYYCGTHRLPEYHLCENLDILKITKNKENAEKLFKEKCINKVI